MRLESTDCPICGSPTARDLCKARDLNTFIPGEYPGGGVLDVGCAVGVVPALMRDAGLDAVGPEPHESACRQARARYYLGVVCAFHGGSGPP